MLTTPTLFCVLLAILLSSTEANSDFSVASSSLESVTSSTNHVSYVKQWTLTATNDDDNDDDSDDDSSDDGDDKIDSIKLQLPGRVFVSYVSGMPSGVLGYVNVSGDSQTVVETAKVDGNDDDEELEVKFDSSTTSGYLLTEIFLSTSNIVKELEIEKSAEVTIEDGVLVASNSNREVQIKASDSSVVYITSSSMSVQDLKLELSDSSSLQLVTDSVTIREDGQFQAHDSSSLTLITSSLTVDDLDLDAENSGTICISASELTASSYDGQDASKISLPNASSKYTATGTQNCEEKTTPAREPGCVSKSNCSTTATSSTTPSATTTSSTTTTSTTTTSSSSGVKTSEQTGSAATTFSTPIISTIAAMALFIVM